MRTTQLSTLLLLITGGCDAFGPGLNGSWEVEAVDVDACTMDLELDQNGDDVDGEADLACTMFFNIYGEQFYYEMEASNADVEGDIDKSDGEFDLEVSFYDSFFEEEIVIELSGEIDKDEMEGEIVVADADWGDFEGRRD